MGLGPPVCEKCWVVTEYEYQTMLWICPFCNSHKQEWNAWDCGIPSEGLDLNREVLEETIGRYNLYNGNYEFSRKE
jgi:hypothetical protein